MTATLNQRDVCNSWNFMKIEALLKKTRNINPTRIVFGLKFYLYFTVYSKIFDEKHCILVIHIWYVLCLCDRIAADQHPRHTLWFRLLYGFMNLRHFHEVWFRWVFINLYFDAYENDGNSYKLHHLK